MHISDRGLALIKEFEGFRANAYKCPASVWTIGYGHTSEAGPPVVREGMRITEPDATAMLQRDVERYERSVMAAVARKPTQAQFDALVSFCYNVGPGALRKSSVLRHFNNGNIPAAADAFRLWNKGGGRVLTGLVRRREAERELFLSEPMELPEAWKPQTRPVEPQSEASAPVAPPEAKTAPRAWLTRLLAWLGLLVAILVALFLAGYADAQTLQVQCGDHKELSAVLREKYGESVRGAGAAVGGEAVFSVWVNPRTETWTITVRDVSGQFCVVAVGEGWQTLPLGQDG